MIHGYEIGLVVEGRGHCGHDIIQIPMKDSRGPTMSRSSRCAQPPAVSRVTVIAESMTVTRDTAASEYKVVLGWYMHPLGHEHVYLRVI